MTGIVPVQILLTSTPVLVLTAPQLLAGDVRVHALHRLLSGTTGATALQLPSHAIVPVLVAVPPHALVAETLVHILP